MSDFGNDIVRGSFESGIATLTLAMEGKVNKINEGFLDGLREAVDWAYAQDGLAGIVFASAHRDFCVGADLDWVYQERDARRIFDGAMQFHQLHRKLETGGVPVVAALTGTALGGGLELALACHRRIAVDDPRVRFGQPEVKLGVIPGGGATQRLPRLIGMQAALEIMVQGNALRAPAALRTGLVDELVPTREAVLERAAEWIAANPGVEQPWDRKGFSYPGAQPHTADARNLFLAASAMLYKKSHGTLPSAEAVISAVHEGVGLQFDRALEVEARHFARLVVSDQAKDMIRTLFFHRTAAQKQEGLPRVEDPGFQKVAIIGAGMMGAGLAYICAQAGYDVVLKDISQDVLDRAMDHIGKQIDRRGRHLDDEARQAILHRVTATLHNGDMAGSDLVVEAVFENIELKHRIIAEVEPLLADNAVFASNTSAIPITSLAEASSQADRFIGLHFFSPVEKMPLLEVICGAQTSEETLARSLAFARRIKKTTIVVNDGYGFYTSRVFAAYAVEGVQLVAEGHDPVLVEIAARRAGMVVPPLQVFDEVSLKLGRTAVTGSPANGDSTASLPAVGLIVRMVDEFGRPGRAGGAGFYDYDGGRRVGIWPGLKALAVDQPESSSVEQLTRRLMIAQTAEVARCLDEGILRNYRDAEVGAILGIGFAPNSGGPLAWMDRQGLPELVAEMDDLAARFGTRFAPAQVLRDMAAKGERFFDDL